MVSVLPEGVAGVGAAKEEEPVDEAEHTAGGVRMDDGGGTAMEIETLMALMGSSPPA
jgi:hypothetical protein